MLPEKLTKVNQRYNYPEIERADRRGFKLNGLQKQIKEIHTDPSFLLEQTWPPKNKLLLSVSISVPPTPASDAGKTIVRVLSPHCVVVCFLSPFTNPVLTPFFYIFNLHSFPQPSKSLPTTWETVPRPLTSPSPTPNVWSETLPKTKCQ